MNRRSFFGVLFGAVGFAAAPLQPVTTKRQYLTAKQRAEIVKAVREAYHGVPNQNPIILDDFIKDVKVIGNRPRDMDFIR